MAAARKKYSRVAAENITVENITVYNSSSSSSSSSINNIRCRIGKDTVCQQIPVMRMLYSLSILLEWYNFYALWGRQALAKPSAQVF